MKRGNQCLMKSLAVLLCAALLLSLVGCGGKGKDKDKNPDGGKEQSAEKTDAFVYVPEYKELSGNENGFNPVAFSANGIYATSYEMIADNTPEGVTPTYEGEYWVYGTVLYELGFDGTVTKINYVPPQIPEGVNGSANINTVRLGDDGNLHLLENVYTYWYDEMPEGVEEYSDEYWQLYEQYHHWEEKYYVRVVNTQGEVLNSFELVNPAGEDGYFYPYNFQVDDEGNYYIPCDMNLYVFDAVGNLKATIESDNYMENIVKFGDGTLYVNNYGGVGYQLSPVDLAGQCLGEPIPIPGDAYYVIPGGGEYDIYYSNGSNFMGYDFETQESKKILNWINCDIDSSYINNSSIHVGDDGTVVVLSSMWDEKEMKTVSELVTLKKQPADSVEQKEIITLATQYLSWDVRGKIIEFNKSNGKYRIEVQDYSEYNTEEDYSAGLTKLTTELLSGKVPDILYLSELPTEQLAAKGYLEDLYPYLDSDPELDREDIFESVRTALEIDGALYSTCDGFTITTVMGAPSVVGDTPGWTVDEYMAALATMPDGCTGFDMYMLRGDILRTCLQLDMASFVDWETGKCNFNSEAFIKLLKFAETFPESFDWNNYVWTEEDDVPNRIASGRQMLYSSGVYDFQEFQMYKAIFGGDVTFIGYPTEYGTGNMMYVDAGYAISSKCENKEGAWQFLRQFFTEEYQTDGYRGNFPSNVNAFNEKLEKAMTPVYRKDEQGNFILDENGNKIEESQGGWGWGNIQVELYALSQEDADQILELINTTTKVYHSDTSIIDIVMEEVAPFFEGQKSAEEVAKLIQSKVSLFVNEQL